MARSGYKLTRGAPGREKEADSLREFDAWDRVRLVPAASFFRVKGRLRKQKGRLSVREPFPLNGRRWPVRDARGPRVLHPCCRHQAASTVARKSSDAARLNTLRTAWSLPHFSSNARVSADARSCPCVNNCALVGLMMINVNGTTLPISRAPTSQIAPPPSHHATIAARQLKTASGACIIVARA